MTLNRDIFVAIFLLLVCGGLTVASLDIREPNYGQLSPATWPRIILGVFGLLSFIYLIQSLRQEPTAPAPDSPKSLSEFFAYWRNVIWCFVLFGAYLISIPFLGILVGGVLFVFLLLTVLGGFKAWALHAVIAAVSVGGMWTIFTFALNVILPRGEWTGI